MLKATDSLTPEERIIVALDCTLGEALDLGKRLQGRAAWMKVGMTLFYRYGPRAVSEFKDLGYKVFLDLKLHDIPHQIRGAAKSACLTGADMLTVHACGAAPMMQAACEGAQEAADELGVERSALLGITVLTSMDQQTLSSVGVQRPVADQVKSLACLAADSGIDGVVASPQEAAILRSALGPERLIVTPGVRPSGADLGDQSRVATPRVAVDSGASHLVVGRPITQAEDPVSAFEAIAAELAN